MPSDNLVCTFPSMCITTVQGCYTPKGICLSGWRSVNKTVIKKKVPFRYFASVFQRISNTRNQRQIDLGVFIFEYNREIRVEPRFGGRPIF